MAAAMECGDRRRAEEHLHRFTELAEELELPLLRWGSVLHSSWLAVLDGDLERADALRTEAQHVGARANRPEAAAVGLTQAIGVRWAQGRAAELIETTGQLRSALPHLDAFRAFEAAAVHASGNERHAQQLLDDARANGAITELAHNQVYLAALVVWAELAYDLDDREAAADVARGLEPYAQQFAFTGTAVYGPVAHALGLLALTTGDRDAASHHFGAAVDMTSHMPAPFFMERAQAAASKRGLVGRG
jgi:hypothetical protein